MKKELIKKNIPSEMDGYAFPEDDDEEFTSNLDFSETRDYQDETEKNRVESIDYEWRQLKDDIFNFRKHIEKEIRRVFSERAIEELNNIFEEVKLMTDLPDNLTF